LIYTNQDPLKPSRKRIQKYFIITGVLTFIAFFSTSPSLPNPTHKYLLFLTPNTDEELKKLGVDLASGKVAKDANDYWTL
tara:strand:- start:40 stop:279 length:240 start_codon:yes stop_codon:yes gene_type:complete